MTDEYVNSVSDRYIELYEHIVGQKFNKADDHDDLAASHCDYDSCHTYRYQNQM